VYPRCDVYPRVTHRQRVHRQRVHRQRVHRQRVHRQRVHRHVCIVTWVPHNGIPHWSRYRQWSGVPVPIPTCRGRLINPRYMHDRICAGSTRRTRCMYGSTCACMAARVHVWQPVCIMAPRVHVWQYVRMYGSTCACMAHVCMYDSTCTCMAARVHIWQHV
jgi:hypothetical protein